MPVLRSEANDKAVESGSRPPDVPAQSLSAFKSLARRLLLVSNKELKTAEEDYRRLSAERKKATEAG